jgi:single-stranded-DNA-specific exonuclease
MVNQRILIKVAGVTFEGRQEMIALLRGGEPVRIVPEPTNPYDPNALRVEVASKGEILHVGYIPRDKAAEYALLLEGENTIGRVYEVNGGFVKWDGSHASYGLIVQFDIPPANEQQ